MPATSNGMYLRFMTRCQTFQAQIWALVAVVVLGVSTLSAQVDQFTSALTDTSRADRVIGLDIRVPSDASEALPWVVFGHGFLMPTSDYDDLATALATAGYAVLMVETETGFAPSHADFGLDLAYVVAHASSDVVEVEGVLGDHVALMGHSMGGGAAWLAAAQLGNAVDALVGLAPAETSPSAIAAGADIVAPTMVISGSSDVVTPPSEHHEPLYASTSSAECRSWVNLVEGGHCGFADDGTLCDFGEITFTGMPRPEQQTHSLACLQLWLEAHLQNEEGALTALEAYAESQIDVEVELACETSATNLLQRLPRAVVGPNPATHVLQVLPVPDAHRFQAFDLFGRQLPLVWVSHTTLDVSGWPRGTALLRVQSSFGQCVSHSTVLIH